jgi:hypothetical protein
MKKERIYIGLLLRWFVLLTLIVYWNGHLPSAMADATEAAWGLRNANDSGGPNYDFGYGNDQCVGVVGDWDGDGTTTIGVACPGETTWGWGLRDYNSAGGVTFPQFNYGSKNCTPITGDWDGDGTTTIGVACPDETTWGWGLRDYNSAGGVTFPQFNYGSISRTPLTGDWDGNGTSTIGVASTLRAGEGQDPETDYVCPVDGPVRFSDDYGNPREGHTHQGNDLFADEGTPLVAVADGTVTRVDNVDTFPTDGEDLDGISLSVVDSKGNRYFYAHNKENVVRTEGERVRKGQLIAYVGKTGNARTTPPHVHFEYHRASDDAKINPYPYLSEWCKGNRTSEAVATGGITAEEVESRETDPASTDILLPLVINE